MASDALNSTLRLLPSVEEVLRSPEIAALDDVLVRSVVTDAVRAELDAIRARIIATGGSERIPDDIPARAARRARLLVTPSLRRVINASGVIIHTNLGRSVLSQSAVNAVVDAAQGYSTLEYDLETMSRGSRHAHCEQLICELTGAEAAIAVNNNAAAVMMVLSEFASEREAVVSRGELVEIGGSFRIPDIMEFSHAHMVEVGTTNKTHAYDYERAITDNTAMLLKVHTSNYRLVGFTESLSARELRRIADDATRARRAQDENAPSILVYEDLGSGALVGLDALGEQNEPTAKEALAAGCDLVSFSGDKLLGGPQAGIIIGAKHLIDRCKKNPLARVLRLDKMTLAALEATLRLYLDPARARAEVPTLRMLEAPASEMKHKADDLAACIERALPRGCARISVVDEVSRAGGGALPMYDIDTFAVYISFTQGSALACEEYLVKRNPVPIIARIRKETLLFDVRTILDASEADEIAAALARYFECVGSEQQNAEGIA